MQSEMEKWQKELRKGSTKVALLSLLRCRDMYGYEIIKELISVTDGVQCVPGPPHDGGRGADHELLEGDGTGHAAS
jgi:hypothetical protein